MEQNRLVIFSAIGGVVLTALSGIIPVRTMLGATHYGFPMAWLVRRVLAPEHFPWRVQWLGLLVDLIVWSIVVFLVLLAIDRYRSRA